MSEALPDSIETILVPAPKDLGEFTVRRTLPDQNRQRVGPFIFWDHMGPAEFPPGAGVSVRPHPHIGLATITYLFEGEIMHRDSLGYVQPITCGAVNWMTGRPRYRALGALARDACRIGFTAARYPGLGRLADSARGDGAPIRALSCG